jgi:hypothetical protein
MIFLILNLTYNSFCIISSFVGKEQAVVLVEEYDRKSLYPMLVKCHEHLHPLAKLETSFANQNIFDQDCNLDIFYQDCSLDIFKQITSTNELVEELVKKELLIFRRYQLHVNVFFNGGRTMK